MTISKKMSAAPPMRKGRIFAYRPIRLFIADYANKETILWSNVLTALLPA